MTFRPSDDVLDEINSDKQASSSIYNYDNNWNPSSEWNWWMFNKTENLEWQITVPDEIANIINNAAEEVKAPDLADLLWWNSSNNVSNVASTWVVSADVSSDNSVVTPISNVASESSYNWEENKDVKTSNLEIEIPGSMADEDRFKIISEMDGAQHSNLDFLVDNQWKEVVDKYKKIHRIVARWWMFICVTLIGVVFWAVVQVKADKSSNIEMVSDASITRRDEAYGSKTRTALNEVWDNLKTIVPYWSASSDSNSFQSRSNLVFYNWIILPQLVSLGYKSDDLISLDDFNTWNVSRSDLENALKYLITNDSIYRKTANLSNPMDVRWQGQIFNEWLIDWFNLSCLDTYKVSDFVCDKFLLNFYQYGKYYNLSRYASEVLELMNTLKNQGRDLTPVCEMIKDYTLRSWITSSEDLYTAMSYCDADDFEYYKKMLDFIDVDNSLYQPELPSRIFDDRDMNAYKLMSARQSLYKILNGTSINENYINSYLVFVQNLINKDKRSGNYLSQLYKELLYVFNADILSQRLLDKWSLSNDIKTKIDMINNGELYRDNISLVQQLKTPDIVKVNETFSWAEIKEKTLDDLFSQFYFMTDYLKIRKVTKMSNTELKVQTEIFTDKILEATAWETLKAIVNLYRLDNILYVDSIKITNQTDFSDILNAYAWNEPVTLPAMIAYIDEQVATWYKIPWKDEEKKEWELCVELAWNEAITLYTCDTSAISLYKWEVEYNFSLLNGTLQSFKISDAELNTEINKKLESVMITKNNTPTIIQSIIDFTIDKDETPNNLDKKLRIIDQFRIHLKVEPDNVTDIAWESDVFLVNFTLWDFDLQARYNVETHLMTRISYVACDKVLEIRNLTMDISSENESQLTAILNNPRVFLTQANQAAYKKYQTLCDG